MTPIEGADDVLLATNTEFIGSPFSRCDRFGANEPDDILTSVVHPVGMPDKYHAPLKRHPNRHSPLFIFRVIRVWVSPRQPVAEDGASLFERDAVSLEI